MTAGDTGSPLVRRWQLAGALKQLREQAGLTQEQAVVQARAAGSRWSESKLSRIENREYGIRPAEVEHLLDVYGLTDERRRGELLELAGLARDRTWEANFGGDMTESLRPLIALEAGATAIRTFEAMVVPGLLQTVEYMRAIIEAVDEMTGVTTSVDRKVARRLARQAILRRAQPPSLHVVLDESVLRRTVARRSVMRDQMRKLVDLLDESYLTIQVLPLDNGIAPGATSPFTLLTLPEPAPEVLYGEFAGSGLEFGESLDRLRFASMVFDELCERALSSGESATLVQEAARGFEK